MYYKHPHENWFQKGIRTTENALKVFGVAKGAYEMAGAIGSGIRTAYQVAQTAGPALALL